jgi:hypothetical protein
MPTYRGFSGKADSTRGSRDNDTAGMARAWRRQLLWRANFARCIQALIAAALVCIAGLWLFAVLFPADHLVIDPGSGGTILCSVDANGSLANCRPDK